MEHCGRSFKHFDTWFLFDNKGFYKREVKLGRCPKCLKVIIEINEIRKSDDRIFTQYAEGKEAQKIAENYKKLINYTALEIKQKACKVTMPKSIRYGENKIVKKGNRKFLKQNAVSWINGKKETIKEIEIH